MLSQTMTHCPVEIGQTLYADAVLSREVSQNHVFSRTEAEDSSNLAAGPLWQEQGTGSQSTLTVSLVSDSARLAISSFLAATDRWACSLS